MPTFSAARVAGFASPASTHDAGGSNKKPRACRARGSTSSKTKNPGHPAEELRSLPRSARRSQRERSERRSEAESDSRVNIVVSIKPSRQSESSNMYRSDARSQLLFL